LKIGTLFPVFKNKGDIKTAKNYWGLTVTPTFSKLMEKIIKNQRKFKIPYSEVSLRTLHLYFVNYS
jgi:hypothetical protein